MKLLVLLLCILGVQKGWTLTATLYKSEKEQESPLFRFSRTEKSLEDGRIEALMSYTDPQGQVVVDQRAVLKGSQIFEFTEENKQLGSSGSMVVKEGRIYFTYTKEGKTKKDDEAAEGIFAAGPTIMPVLQGNWADLMKGNSIRVRWGVFDRVETVGFEFSKINEESWNGNPAVMVRMKPSSWIISKIVDPLYFRIAKDGSRVLTIQGRTTPKLNVNGTWKDLDCFTVYQ